MDNGVCHPRNNDLSAHARMIGASRPTDYYVLHNEIGFSADDLHELVHFLSYVCTNLLCPAWLLLRCCNSSNSMKCLTHLLVMMVNICKNSTTLFYDKSYETVVTTQISFQWF